MAKQLSKSNKSKADIMEWVVAALGMVLLAAALGSITYRAVTEGPTPPRLRVAIESINSAGDGFQVIFKVHNEGSTTAAGVIFEGELTDTQNGESVEKSTSTLTYAPANSVRRGGMYFTRDPALHMLRIRPSGFENP